MLSTAIIVFREVLEAALIISIIIAATRGVAHRGKWVALGAAAGLLGAGVIAMFADVIAEALTGRGQEMFNAGILFTAVAMLGWHNIWMKQHGKQLAMQMSAMGRSVLEGSQPLRILAVVIGLALLREGSEVVLFLYGIASAQATSANTMLVGGLIGIAAGSTLGYLLYRGLLKIPSKHLFAVTGWLILLLAAGMSAHGAAYLVQIDLLPPLGHAIWDTSGIISEISITGKLLSTLVGYVARPDGIQVLFYFATIILIGGLMKLLDRQPARIAITA